MTTEDRIDLAVGRTLLGGLLLSVAMMVIGLIVTAEQGVDVRHVLPLDRVPADLFAGQGRAVLDLGILLLFASPLAGVLIALGSFLRYRVSSFAMITSVLVVILIAGFAVALIRA
ncbi:MAG: DUF1634 domain-containing protein [Chloroflexota bacterium]